MTDQKLQQLAREYANKHLTSGCFNVNGEPRVDVRDLAYFYETLLSDIAKTHCIVSRKSVKTQWLIIEHDKKQMLEKSNPIGEQVALAGVYQAKLELIDKLFGESTFDERSEK